MSAKPKIETGTKKRKLEKTKKRKEKKERNFLLKRRSNFKKGPGISIATLISVDFILEFQL
jgi:hypothetical protein